jgi:hypothetical protein
LSAIVLLFGVLRASSDIGAYLTKRRHLEHVEASANYKLRSVSRPREECPDDVRSKLLNLTGFFSSALGADMMEVDRASNEGLTKADGCFFAERGYGRGVGAVDGL